MARTTLMLLIGSLLLGCGGAAEPRGAVTGKVSYKGKPIARAMVLFYDEDGGALASTADAEGGFTVRTHQGAGLPPGSYRVAVQPAGADSGPAPVYAGQEGSSKAPPALVPPARFHLPATSGLAVTVQAGENPPLVLDLPD